MTNKVLVWIALAFLACVVIADSSVQDIYVAGDFLMTIIDDSDDSLHHICGIATYSPNSNAYVDTFGGVYESTGAKLTEIQWTTFGLYTIGNFRFITDSFSYSNSVARYDDDGEDGEGRYNDMGNGIWTDYGEAVTFIVGTSDDVIFAGSFSRVEDISLAAYVNDDADPVVPNIVRYAPDDNTWELLDDPDNVLPDDNAIDGLASEPEGGSSHVYVHVGNGSGALYRWSRDDSWEYLIPLNVMANSLIVDRNGNPAGINFYINGPSGLDPRTYSLSYVDKDNNWAVSNYTFLEVGAGVQLNSVPQIIAYQDNILITAPGNPNFTTSDFIVFNPADQTLDDTAIPELNLLLQQVVEGNDGDLYAAPVSATAELYYYTQDTWTQISLTPLGNNPLSIVYMTFDFDKDALYVYALDTVTRQYIWFTLDSTSFPPTPTLKRPGILAYDGKVASIAVIKDTNDDDFGVWIGGSFSAVGNGVLADNLACFKNGQWEPYSKPEIVSMVAKGSTLIMAYQQCALSNNFLPISTFSTDDSDDNFSFGDSGIPEVVGGAGCVYALYSDANYLFVGGNFTVSIPGSSATASAIVYYSWEDGTWSGVGIPANISSSGDGYQILSLTVTQFTNAGALNTYLAFGGHFDLYVGGNEYHGFAVYNVDSGEWVAVPALQAESIVYELVGYTDNQIYIGGRILLSSSSPVEGVIEYNYTTNSYSTVGELNDLALAILLVTTNLDDDDDSNDDTIVYAGGDFEDSTTNFQYGLAGYEFTGNSNSTWSWASGNTFDHYYFGTTGDLIYQTGGVGQNGTNGNYDISSGGGGNGWWISLLVIAIIGLIILAVVAGVGGFVYYKKRTVYQEIN